ncbi:MAG: hypothetical protein B7X55_03755 [Rhodobacterales bacterium 34-62-10]|nr:MAG: hypothetical protein B7X55_03755 [Rhodobacterales bacterium 34-62-10]
MVGLGRDAAPIGFARETYVRDAGQVGANPGWGGACSVWVKTCSFMFGFTHIADLSPDKVMKLLIFSKTNINENKSLSF